MKVEAEAVVATDLTARFGSLQALRGVSCRLLRGQRLAILGPNGAGKTTFLRVLAGLHRRSGGELLVAGLDPDRDGAALRARIGFAGHQTYLYGELTASENLRFYGRLYGVENLNARVLELLEQIGLYVRRADRVDSLSRGQQQRLALGRAILHEPEVLLLDEPDTGLDLRAVKLLESLLDAVSSENTACGGQRSVIVATHSAEQARQLCGSALVLVGGELVAELQAAEVSSERLDRLYSQESRLTRAGTGGRLT